MELNNLTGTNDDRIIGVVDHFVLGDVALLLVANGLKLERRKFIAICDHATEPL